jgi:exonuclease III
VNAQSEEKSDDSKDRFYEELEHVYDHFPKKQMKIILGDFNVMVGRENIFKPRIFNESLHQDSNNNGVRIVNFATSENLVAMSMMFPHRYIHKYTCNSPDRNTHKQIDHILTVGNGIRLY